jgi:hypothetical protein
MNQFIANAAKITAATVSTKPTLINGVNIVTKTFSGIHSFSG